ncbi:MAG: glycoside hydrolase domain-containing protein, partial [Candidatus Omnitrophota bacterium]
SYGEEQVNLLNIDISPAELFTGDMVAISCGLEITERLPKEHFLFLHLEGTWPGAYVNADIHALGPQKLWEPNKRIDLGPFYIYVPLDLPEGEYRVTMGLSSQTRTATGAYYKKLPYSNQDIHDWAVGAISIKKRSPEPVIFADEYGYGVMAADSLKKIFQERAYLDYTSDRDSVTIYAARGEYESFQIVVVPGEDDLQNVEVLLEDDFFEKNGRGIGKENVTLYKVGYVKTEKPYYNTVKVGLWPDPLIPLKEPFDVPKETVQPVWATVYVPKETLPGKYKSTVIIHPSGKKAKSVDVTLHVWGFSIPKRANLKTAFDFYAHHIKSSHPRKQHEDGVFWKLRVQRLLESYYLDMLKHRISPIHNVGNPKFLGEEDGKYHLAFDKFDKEAAFYLENGQACFGIAQEWPWGYRGEWTDKWYGYTDQNAVVGVFGEYGKHLEEKGWLNISYAYIFDETLHRVKDFTRLIHEGNPGIKNLVTMAPRKGYPDVDIWCVRVDELVQPAVSEFQRSGKDIWMYVAGTTRPCPNLNLDVPAIEHRIIPWICWKYGAKGLLYWCVNYWSKTDPWKSAMTFSEQNGNGSLYYPDPEGENPVGSIRLEVLRDGLEDYEYFYLLNDTVNLIKKNGFSSDYHAGLSEAEDALRVNNAIVKTSIYYTRDNKRVFEERERIGRLIEELAK